MFNKLLDGYGSFFALTHPASRILIFLAAMLQPYSGLYGLLGGISVLVANRLLKFQSDNQRIEVVNGILLGMLIGSLYASDVRSILLTIVGGTLIVMFSAIATDLITRNLRLPLLGLPYAAVSFLLLPVATSLQLAPAPAALTYSLNWLPQQLVVWLYPIGAMYFNGTTVGGLLVLIAFTLSSRYLAMIAVASSITCCVYLSVLAVPNNVTLFMVAQMNGVLSACIIGGLCAVPGRRSLIVSTGAALLACTISLCLSRLLWIFGLPVLALPFVLSTYCCMLAFNAQRGRAWTYFWLPTPALPERSLEQMEIAKARGVDVRSVGLRAPFDGAWQVYQGFGGAHTHQGAWQYALDFFQLQNGKSYAGTGDTLSDYYAFGEPICSPVFGTVVECRSDVADNSPGEVDTVNNWGNYVLIQLDSGLCVMLAHLKRHSVKVKPLSRVTPGQLIAACGNSGRSPQPHLHIHVQEDQRIGSRTLPFHMTVVVTKSDAEARSSFSLRTCPKEGDSVASPDINTAFKRSMRLTVGSRFQFEVTQPNVSNSHFEVDVNLDMYGQFWLESGSGARVAFTVNDEFLAFYGRSGPKDPILDALILSLGLTPFAEGIYSWTDATPKRILPIGLTTRIEHAVLHPIQGCANSRYYRTWDATTQLWVQNAQHTLGKVNWVTEAKLCESDGLIGFAVLQEGKPQVRARLIGYGIKEDNGIPEQRTMVASVV